MEIIFYVVNAQEGKKMKELKIIFNDREFAKVKKVKEVYGMNWHDWILWLVEKSANENQSKVK